MISQMRTLELTSQDGLLLTAVLSLPGEALDERPPFDFADETVVQFYLGTKLDRPLATCAFKTLARVTEDFSLQGTVLEKAELARVRRWVNEEKAKAESYKSYKARPFVGTRPSGLAERLAA